ncbi:MAG: Hsp20/alpha crystallin family protein [Candidatus Aminicenantes bacterium]|nr:Hsp20/alpha crystallin family protein [Candidatus Aminicenantes bacterium]
MRETIEDEVQVWGSWSPPIDIRISKERMRIFIEVPGVEASTLNLRIEGNHLLLEGRKMPPRAKRILFTEREYGDFFVMIKLNEDISTDSVKAKLSHGVLEIEFKRTRRNFKVNLEEKDE